MNRDFGGQKTANWFRHSVCFVLFESLATAQSAEDRTRMNQKSEQPLIGWREWLSLPALGIDAVKAKVDTGARSSCLHAYDIEQFERENKTWVRFVLHPLQRSTRETVNAEAEVLEFRSIRSSNGQTSTRPVIVTNVLWNNQEWPVELTLVSRDDMGFRMLLGREGIRSRFLVDSGKSWLGGKPSQAARESS